MLSQVDDSVREFMAKQLPIQILDPEKSDNNPRGDWATGTFYNMPTLAAVTLFSKLQNDVRNAEAQILNQLFKEADAKQIKFDAITAIAVPKQSYLLQNQKVEAEIMLAAYNKSVVPSISTSSGRVQVSEGVGHWEGVASGVGLQTVRGTLTVDLGSSKVTKPWEFQYTVGTAGASLQLDKMNVFYIGVPNPITVSAAGYAMEDISLSIPGAEVTAASGRGRGAYDISVPMSLEGKTVEAAINAKDPSKGVVKVGTMPIRVKRIPDPEAQVGGTSGGGMQASTFRVQLGINALLKNFEFDARYVVTSFTFSMLQKRNPDIIGPFPVNGPLFSGNRDVVNAINNAKAGDKIFIEEIRAKGPDGSTRRLNSVVLSLY